MKRALLISVAAALLMPFSVAFITSGGGGGGSYRAKIGVTDTLYVAVGRQINLWYHALSPTAFGMTGATYSCTADSGLALDRSYRYNALAVNNFPLLITGYDAGLKRVGRATTHIVAVSDTAGKGEADVLMVGDSVLANGQAVGVVDTLFSNGGGGSIALMGTQGSGSILHEGNSGYKWSDYGTAGDISHPNPFWNGAAVDFQTYTSDNSLPDNIDYCFAMAGYNDMYALADTLASADLLYSRVLCHIDTFIDAMMDESTGYPDCKVIVGLQGFGAGSLSAVGNGYGAAGWWPIFVRNIAALNAAIIARYDAGAYHAHVSVCPVGLWLDRDYGYPYSSAAASSRSSVQVAHYTNWLHPRTSGYRQIGDAIYSHLRGLRRLEQEPTAPYNLLIHSEDFTHASWTKTSAMSLTGTTSDPWGGNRAQEWTTQANAAGYVSLLYATSGLRLADHNVFSVYYKRDTVNLQGKLRVSITAGSPSSYSIETNQTGSGTPGLAWYEPACAPHLWADCSGNLPGSYTFTDAGNGWWRCEYYFQGGGDTGKELASIRVYMERATNVAAHTVFVTGAQFEQGVTSARAYQRVAP